MGDRHHARFGRRHMMAGASMDSEVSLAEATCSSSSGTELPCPFCYEDFTDVGSLLAHIEEEEHAHPRRTVRCPICSRSARDMTQHLLAHMQLYEDLGCSSPSSQASSSRSLCPTAEWAREEEALLKAKHAVMASSSLQMPAVSGSEPQHKLKQPAYPPAQPSAAPALEAAAQGAGHSAIRSLSPAKHKPKPEVVDTPELRAAFVRQLLMSAFELDGES